VTPKKFQQPGATKFSKPGASRAKPATKFPKPATKFPKPGASRAKPATKFSKPAAKFLKPGASQRLHNSLGATSSVGTAISYSIENELVKLQV